MYCLSHTRVEILIADHDIFYKIIEDGHGNFPNTERILSGVSDDLISELENFKIPNWKRSYFNLLIFDGEDWDLTFEQGDETYYCSGSNAGPSNFLDFFKWIGKIIPEVHEQMELELIVFWEWENIMEGL